MVKMVSAGHLLTVDVVETQIISRPRKPVIQRAVMRVIFRQKKYFEPEIVRVTVRYFGIVPGQCRLQLSCTLEILDTTRHRYVEK